ncbi:MAG: hypothetical protein ACYS8Z_21050 [Planctomycetota bacterium]|jgi:hypothetical protein
MFDIGLDRMAARGEKLRVRDDLLQIVLDKRLGRPVSFEVQSGGEGLYRVCNAVAHPTDEECEYIVDVGGKKILSAGADGEVGTKDDVSLPIDPGVLGWGNGSPVGNDSEAMRE